MMARRVRRVGFFPLLIVLIGSRLNAQDAKKIAHLNIVVIDRTNAYVSGAQIKVCLHAGTLPKTPQIYEYGTMRLDLAPGIYDLFVASPAYAPWYKQIDLREESSQALTAVLQLAGRSLVHVGHGWAEAPAPAPEQLDISVMDEGGTPIAYALLDGFPDATTMKADEKGKLRLKVTHSTYLVAVTSPGYERWEKVLEINPHIENSVEVILKHLTVP